MKTEKWSKVADSRLYMEINLLLRLNYFSHHKKQCICNLRLSMDRQSWPRAWMFCRRCWERLWVAPSAQNQVACDARQISRLRYSDYTQSILHRPAVLRVAEDVDWKPLGDHLSVLFVHQKTSTEITQSVNQLIRTNWSRSIIFHFFFFFFLLHFKKTFTF